MLKVGSASQGLLWELDELVQVQTFKHSSTQDVLDIVVIIILQLLDHRISICYVQFCSVMSNSLEPHGLQHSRLPCPSPTPRACSNSCPSSQWCHPTISSSVAPFSSCLQSFPASGSFPISQFFTSGGQIIQVSALASVLPMNIQNCFPLGLTSWISLQSKRLSRVFSNTTVQKHQFFGAQASLWSNSHIHTWLLEKTIVLNRWTFVGKGMSLLFNTCLG